MPTSMKAVRLPGGRRVEIIDRAIPQPKPNEVLVRVRASAICASDLSLYEGSALVGGSNAGKGTITPGHEPAGDILEVGSAVTHLRTGQRVVIHLSVGCMRCEYCLAGYLQQCPQWQCVGFDLDGGDAEYIVVPEVNCLPLADELSYESGAVMVDNFGTQYHTQKRLGVSGADVAAVIGIGPMGAAAVATAKARGAQVVALDVVEHRLALATKLGADYVINVADGNALEQLRDLTNGRGPEVSIDCSGRPDGENLALDATAKLGRVAFVGECASVTINPSEQMIRKELDVVGAWVFPIYDYFEMSRFLIRHGVVPEQTVSHRYQLDSAAEAFDQVNRRLADKVMFTFD